MEPSYDFIYAGGSDAQQPLNNLRQTLRQSRMENLTDTATTEDLRARIRTLEYESAQWRKDRDVQQLKHDKDLSDVRLKLETELRRVQTAQNSEKTAGDRYDALLREIREERDRSTSERSDLERKARNAITQRDALQEELDDAQEQLGNQDRDFNRRLNEANARHNGLQKTYTQVKEDFENKDRAFRNAQTKLMTQEERIGEMEAESLQLKASSEDVGTVALLRRELTEQTESVKRLHENAQKFESQVQEMRQSRMKQVQLESENVLLREKHQTLETVQTELQQAQVRARALEDEKNAWASYLSDDAASDPNLKIDSPEDLARAYMRERIARTSLEQDLGNLQAELQGKDSAIRVLDEAKLVIQAELKKLKGDTSSDASSAADNKARLRLERQRALAVKETEYLRAQLKAFETDAMEEADGGDATNQSDKHVNARIQQMEDLLDSHRKEVETLNAQFIELDKSTKRAEEQRQSSVSQRLSLSGTKRSLDQDHNEVAAAAEERLGEMSRRHRQLQNDMSRLQSRYSTLENESKAQQSQLASLKSRSKVRVLEFKDNPTSKVEKVKMDTLAALREENEVLKGQMENKLPSSTASAGDASDERLIPRSSLQSLQLQLSDKDATIASRDKSLLRLKDIFRAKGGEFVEAVFSLLGYKLDFMPNGRVRVRSMYHPSSGVADASVADAAAAANNDKVKSSAPENNDEDEEESFIMFDGEAGTMKVSGGPNSPFAREIRGLLDFWVEGRGSVPCLLAAMTLEFWDRYREGGGVMD